MKSSVWRLSLVIMCPPPSGGKESSPTKCLLYPFPVSRPITWRYYLREGLVDHVSSHMATEKRKVMNEKWIWNTSVCKIKVMFEIRKNDHMGCRRALKEDQKGPKCIQKWAQEASKTRDATREIQKRTPGGGLGSQRCPRGQPRPKSIKFSK